MIRKTVLSALVFFLLIPSLVAGDEAEVEAAERAWAKAIEQKDYTTLEKVLADNLYYSHSNFYVDTKRSFINNLKSGRARYWEIQSLEVNVLDGKTALAMAVAESQTKRSDGSRRRDLLKTLNVYRKNNGQWQMTAHQSAQKPN